jgi:hypothetical protein
VETQIRLNKFKPRNYQVAVLDALENKSYKKILAIWPRRCLSGQSHILMANGSYKLLKDIVCGDKIVSWNGWEIVPDKVVNIWKTETKKTKIISSGGYLPLIASYDHLFATTNQNRETTPVRWEKASEIGPRRSLLSYAGMPLGNVHNPDLAEFIGYMTCDGYISGYQQPKFTSTNKEILDRVSYLAKKLFDYDAIWREKGNGYDLGLTNGTKGGGYTHNKIKELFRAENLDVPKSRKRLLSIVWDLDEESLGRFFAAVISADGNMYLQKDRPFSRSKNLPNGAEITLNCGMSYELGWDMYWLLRKMGITPQNPYKEKNANWRIKIGKCFGVKKLLSYGTIYGKEEYHQKVLDRLSAQNKSIALWNGCYRSRVKTQEGPEEELYDIGTESNHNFIANGYVVHNSGKDVVAFNYMVRSAIKLPGVYYYIFPTYSQARKVVWDAVLSNGTKFIDFIPPELIYNTNSTEMKITFINGSLIQLLGSDDYNKLVGTNPRGIVFSEYALQDPMAYQFLRPAITANDGWVFMATTPRGKNHLWDLYNIALNQESWFVQRLTCDQTCHLTPAQIQSERELLSEDLIQQEFYCDFSLGVEGSYYSKYLDKMRIKGQIGNVPFESAFKVHTSWDIGFSDSTAIIFYQSIGQVVHIIDCYENSKVGLEHYVKIIEQKGHEHGYIYGKHFAPHDIRNASWSSGVTRIDKARQLGINFSITPSVSIEDGIEALRSAFSKIWIDENKCKQLLKCLENYRQVWDSKRKVYSSVPLHNWASNFSDSARYLALNLPRSRDGLSAEELEKRYQEAMLGDRNVGMPAVFRDDLPNY